MRQSGIEENVSSGSTEAGTGIGTEAGIDTEAGPETEPGVETVAAGVDVVSDGSEPAAGAEAGDITYDEQFYPARPKALRRATGRSALGRAG